jgi:thiamine-phosphate pyrophosphorylase
VLLVAGDGRAALRFRAGLHVPDRRPAAGLLPFLLARRRRPRRPPPLLAAAHGRRGIARARRLGADAVVLSPASPPPATRRGGARPLRWAALARRAGRPAVALGGVRGDNARRLPAWAAGFAAVGGLSRAGRGPSRPRSGEAVPAGPRPRLATVCVAFHDIASAARDERAR